MTHSKPRLSLPAAPVAQLRPKPVVPLRPKPDVETGQAPWIQPGVVVHDPDDRIDGLLAQFALGLRGRGFNVAGYVQGNNQGCTGTSQGCAPRISYFDVASGETLNVERGAATHYLRTAMRENADLLVISRFAACTEATEDVGAEVSAVGGHGMPLLTSIAGGCIHKWHSYARQDGAMIAPDIGALWRWWGPERLYRDLILGIADDPVHRIACGSRWMMVQGPHGTGLSYTAKPPHEIKARSAFYQGRSLRELAGLALSWDAAEMALGIAAINAHYNRHDLDGRAGNGVRGLRKISGRMVAVGAFPGIDGILPQCQVIETDPRPGEFPVVAMETLLPGCAAAVVNSSALVNRSLPRILRLTPNRPVALIGPATPMTPRLFDYGLDLLGGLQVSDPDGLAAAIRAGALPREFSKFGKFIHIQNKSKI